MRFSFKHDDLKIQDIQREVEDNLVGKDEVKDLQAKVKTIEKKEPAIKSLSEGEQKVYDDGTNQFLYLKAGGRMFKVQLTEI